MWQKAGSLSYLENRDAMKYINELNEERFASHSNWRMPTVEELASLLKQTKINGVHIAPVFDNHQTICWTADKSEALETGLLGAWVISFREGQILRAGYSDNKLSYFNRDSRYDKNYVKAVRTP